MDPSRSFSTLSPVYNAFLFAPVCEDASGMTVSMLSAFARMDVDPWGEATRLTAMSHENAQNSLVSMLNLVPGRDWKPCEVEGIAARLIELLPHREESVAQAPAVKVCTGPAKYWLVWLTFALVVSSFSPHRRETDATDTTVPITESAQTLPKGDVAGTIPPVTYQSR
jgi:hypothetical protein